VRSGVRARAARSPRRPRGAGGCAGGRRGPRRPSCAAGRCGSAGAPRCRARGSLEGVKQGRVIGGRGPRRRAAPRGCSREAAAEYRGVAQHAAGDRVERVHLRGDRGLERVRHGLDRAHAPRGAHDLLRIQRVAAGAPDDQVELVRAQRRRGGGLVDECGQISSGGGPELDVAAIGRREPPSSSAPRDEHQPRATGAGGGQAPQQLRRGAVHPLRVLGHQQAGPSWARSSRRINWSAMRSWRNRGSIAAASGVGSRSRWTTSPSSDR
jgi:hypothetical protein